MLCALKEWSLVRNTALEDSELELAKKVYEDFNRWPAMDQPEDLHGVASTKDRLNEMQGKCKAAFSAYEYDNVVRIAKNMLAIDEHCVTAMEYLVQAKIERNLDANDLHWYECLFLP